MMKKSMCLFIINTMSFGSIMASVYFEFGMSFFIRIIIPLAVIFATNLSIALLLLKKEQDIKKTGDDSLS